MGHVPRPQLHELRRLPLIHNGADASYLQGHGVPVSTSPTVGAIAWWNANANGASSSGHVAYVEEVGSGYIITSEDNYGGDFHWVRRAADSYSTGCIHFRDLSSTGEGSFVTFT